MTLHWQTALNQGAVATTAYVTQIPRVAASAPIMLPALACLARGTLVVWTLTNGATLFMATALLMASA